MRRLKREDPAGANGGAFGKLSLAGDAAEDTETRPNRQPLAKRKEAYLRLHPETGKTGPRNPSCGEVRHNSFADDQAAKTGVAARTVRQNAERGEKISNAAMAMIVELGAIRRATDAELRRAARLGMIGGRA